MEETKSGDFTFIINDNATYHTLADFKSSNARLFYSQALELEKQLEYIVKELKDKRDQYSSGGVDKSSLRSSILELERVSENLYLEIERMKIQARNDEIRSNFN